jgi:hypothetical protein
MEPHCALKVTRHLLKNKRHYHHNAIDRFGIIRVTDSGLVRGFMGKGMNLMAKKQIIRGKKREGMSNSDMPSLSLMSGGR